MGCDKKTFNYKMDADQRAIEINEENALTNKQPKQLRAYLCPDCKSFHLTSMPDKIYKGHISAINSDTKMREKRFISTETRFWEKYYKDE